MPPGFRPSSGNNAQLVAAGVRVHGGASTESHSRHEAGIAPYGPLEGDPQGDDWGGHAWTAWVPLQDVGRHAPFLASGLYRIRGTDPVTLLYVGEGNVRGRLTAHLKKTADAHHPQGIIFATQDRLESSWTINGAWLDHQRLELENDLIAAHIIETRIVPAAQFLEETRRANDRIGSDFSVD